MTWFTTWWDSLGIIQQVFACVAIPSTIILILQTILLLFGLGGSHDIDHGDVTDYNTDHDSSDHSDGASIFTIKGIVAFFSVGGWLGISLIDLGLSLALSSLLAFLGGSLALVLVAYILKAFISLQDNGNITLSNAIGCEAQVYITIPANKAGTGKVSLLLQERFVELDAMTDSSKTLKTGSTVTVIGIIGNNILSVMPQGAELIFESTKQYAKTGLN